MKTSGLPKDRFYTKLAENKISTYVLSLRGCIKAYSERKKNHTFFYFDFNF